MNVQDALAYWQDKKLLTKKEADKLSASLPDASEQMHSRAIGIFTALGAILIGLGIILFVGSHWDEMTPTVKTALLLITMLITGAYGYYLAYEKKVYQKTGMALLFLNVLVFGATIFLVAQIYHLPMDFWWGALLWFLGTVFFAYILQSRLHLWLSVPLLILFVGWLRTSYSSSGELNFLFDGESSNIFPFLPAIGIGLISASLLHTRQELLFGAKTLFHWGIFLLLFILVLSTVDKTVFFIFLQYPIDTLSISILLVSAAVTIAALLRGTFVTMQGKKGLIALILYILFSSIIAYVPVWMGLGGSNYPGIYDGYYSPQLPMLTGLYVLHILLVFVFILTVIWYGTLLRRAVIVNLGITAVAIAIIIQYFSWTFDLLPQSFAFILGGILILVLGFALEHQRRRLITSMQKV